MHGLVAEISRKKNTVVSVSISPFASEMRKEGECVRSWCRDGQRRPFNTQPYALRTTRRTPDCHGLWFLSQLSFLPFGAPGCCAKMSVNTIPTEPRAKFLLLPRDSAEF